MSKQIKTKKILSLITRMKSFLREDNNIDLHYYTSNDTVHISYSTCVRREYPKNVAKRYKNDIDRFVKLYNETPFSKGNKLKPINLKNYEDDDYSEYEIEVGRNFSIKLGKNQTQFFKKD